MACDTCGKRLTDVEIARYAANLDSNPEWQTIMTAVAIAESGGCTSCYNGTCCTGLWQVHKTHAGKAGSPTDPTAFREWLRNPTNNTMVAAQIYRSQGPEAWQAFTNQSYRNFIARARKVTGVSGPSISDIVGAGVGALDDLPFGDLNPINDIVGLLTGPVKWLSAAASWIGNPQNWIRILQVGGGLVLGAVAISIALSSTEVAKGLKP